MPLLQDEAALRVDQEDRKGAMQKPGAVDGIFAGGTDRAVVLVHQDQPFVIHRGDRSEPAGASQCTGSG